MNRDPRIILQDIIDACERIIANVSAMSIGDFRQDINMQDAVIRRFEIIGEAVKRLPDEVKDRYINVPWKYAAGFRDVLIHDYSEVVIDQVYITGKEHLPNFMQQVLEVLKLEDKDQ